MLYSRLNSDEIPQKQNQREKFYYINHCSSSIIHYSLFITYCLLIVIYHLSFAIYCLSVFIDH